MSRSIPECQGSAPVTVKLVVGSHFKAVAVLVIVLLMSSAQCVAGCIIAPCQNEQAANSGCHQSQDGKSSRVPQGSCSHDEATIEASATKAYKTDSVLFLNAAALPIAAIEVSFSVTAPVLRPPVRSPNVLSTTVLKI